MSIIRDTTSAHSKRVREKTLGLPHSLNAESAPEVLRSDVRTDLFRLEAMMRIVNKIEGSAEATLKLVKEYEDLIGRIDFAEWVLSLCNETEASDEIVEKARQQQEKSIQEWNEIMGRAGWFTDKAYSEIERTIQKSRLAAKKNRKQLKKIEVFLRKTIRKVEKRFEKGQYDFNLPEEGIHELRRNLRWLSIYAAALNGYVQLKTEPIEEKLRAVITKEIVESPYNQLPPPPSKGSIIIVGSNAFYLMSYFIQEIGDIKDKLLAQEWMKKAGDGSDSNPALRYLEKKDGSEAELKQKALILSNRVMKEFQLAKRLRKSMGLKKISEERS